MAGEMRSIPGRSAPIALLAAALAAVLAAGCTTLVSAPGGSGIPTATEITPADPLHRQAHEALARWADAVAKSGGAAITFTGDLTSQIGDWEPENGDNKAALMAGKVETMIDLPADRPSRNEVKWLDGTTQGVAVLSAVAALEDLRAEAAAAGGACDECAPLRITEARLATTLVETSRGPANAPTWVFAVAGSEVQVTRVAVDDAVSVQPPPWDAEHPPEGISIDRAIGTADSKDLEVSFVGAPKGKDEPCGADYIAEAVESQLAVVILVIEDRNPLPASCPALGAVRTAKVKLDAKLGTRAVLEGRQGLPVPLGQP
jgi:hypothetical protein